MFMYKITEDHNYRARYKQQIRIFTRLRIIKEKIKYFVSKYK